MGNHGKLWLKATIKQVVAESIHFFMTTITLAAGDSRDRKPFIEGADELVKFEVDYSHGHVFHYGGDF